MTKYSNVYVAVGRNVAIALRCSRHASTTKAQPPGRLRGTCPNKTTTKVPPPPPEVLRSQDLRKHKQAHKRTQAHTQAQAHTSTNTPLTHTPLFLHQHPPTPSNTERHDHAACEPTRIATTSRTTVADSILNGYEQPPNDTTTTTTTTTTTAEPPSFLDARDNASVVVGRRLFRRRFRCGYGSNCRCCCYWR